MKSSQEPASHEIIDDTFALLPLLAEIIEQIASSDSITKGNVVTKPCSDFSAKLADAIKFVDSIPGGELSRQSQRVEYQKLQDVLAKKRTFLQAFALDEKQ